MTTQTLGGRTYTTLNIKFASLEIDSSGILLLDENGGVVYSLPHRWVEKHTKGAGVIQVKQG